ncbi:MAG: hypothetical protein OHK0013_24840 [Sandaracinaceae bacterium]
MLAAIGGRVSTSGRSISKGGWLLTLVVASSLVSLLVAALVPDAEAQRGRRGSSRRRGATAAAAPQEAPESAAIAPALEEAGIRWGMTPREAFDHFTKQLQERYRPRLAKAPGAIEEDRLRSEMQAEQQRMRRTFIRFTGQPSGWDSSFLRDEFTHGNGEAMLVVREEDVHATSHYFFINERLWKRYQAFDASAFGGATFEQFAAAIQRRFGPGVERSGSLVEGRPPTRWIEWQDATTRLRAIDQTRFYGFFCLVFEDKATLAQLPSLRTHTIQRQQGGPSLVDSVIRDDSEGSSAAADTHADIADRITGQIRRRSDAPTGGQAGASGSGGSASSGAAASGSSSASSSGRSGGRPADDDPFAGMDL